MNRRNARLHRLGPLPLLLLAPAMAAVATTPPRAPAPTLEAPASAPALAEYARRAMEAGEYEQALASYAKLRELRPDLAEIPYNMAVAHHRLQQHEAAATLLTEALGTTADPELAARAAHNLLSSVSEQVRPFLPGPDGVPAAPPDPQKLSSTLETTPEQLERALDQFKKALETRPDDLEARRDGEVAHRLIKTLEALREQMQQQQQQGQDQQEQDPQEQEQEQEQEQQEQEQQEQQQGQEQQEQEQEQQEQQDQEQQQQQQQQQQDEGESEQEAQPQPSPGEEQEAEEPSEAEAAEAGEEKPMTPEEADRLLQQVRDKERQRRREKNERRRSGQPRVDKDW